MNQFNFVGNLTKNVEMKKVKVGKEEKSVAVLSIAMDNSNLKVTEPTYVDVSVWGKKAENCSLYLKKGCCVRISGHVRNNNYEKDGKKVYSYAFEADDVEFLSGALNKESAIHVSEDAAKETLKNKKEG